MAILELRGLTKHFGGVKAVQQVDLSVEEGSITALIGPNGAGKTTCFNMITGLYEPTAGELVFQGRRGEKQLVGLRPDEIAATGIARTFQNIRLCAQQTVLDNVRLGFHTQRQSHFWDILFATRAYHREEAQMMASARAAIRFVGLNPEDDRMFEALLADSLPYGDKRRLEIARALASDPRLLLLDEPAAGMNPQETVVLIDLIRKIRDHGVTIFLIEHDMKMVMEISDRVVVLDHGKKIADGTPEEVHTDPQVIAAYLGAEESKKRSDRLPKVDAEEAEGGDEIPGPPADDGWKRISDDGDLGRSEGPRFSEGDPGVGEGETNE